MFSTILFLLLVNFIVFYKEIYKVYNYYLNKNDENLENYLKKIKEIFIETGNKLKKFEENIWYEYYGKEFDIDSDDDNYDQKITNEFFETLNKYKKFKCIIYKLNKEDNDIDLLNKIILFTKENKIKLYLFGNNKLDIDNEKINDFDKFIIDNQVNYLSPYNFYSSLFGYLKKLPNNQINPYPCIKEIPENKLVEEISIELNLEKSDIVYLDEKIFKKWENLDINN